MRTAPRGGRQAGNLCWIVDTNRVTMGVCSTGSRAYATPLPRTLGVRPRCKRLVRNFSTFSPSKLGERDTYSRTDVLSSFAAQVQAFRGTSLFGRQNIDWACANFMPSSPNVSGFGDIVKVAVSRDSGHPRVQLHTLATGMQLLEPSTAGDNDYIA